jgi:hypothetical protein
MSREIEYMSTKKEELFKLSRENLEWLKENYRNLRKNFDNQWVVIQNKQIVAKGSTYKNIVNSLEKLKLDKRTAIVEFIDSKQLAMFF